MAKEKRWWLTCSTTDEELVKAVKEKAAEENRNVNNYIETILKKAVAA